MFRPIFEFWIYHFSNLSLASRFIFFTIEIHHQLHLRVATHVWRSNYAKIRMSRNWKYARHESRFFRFKKKKKFVNYNAKKRQSRQNMIRRDEKLHRTSKKILISSFEILHGSMNTPYSSYAIEIWKQHLRLPARHDYAVLWRMNFCELFIKNDFNEYTDESFLTRSNSQRDLQTITIHVNVSEDRKLFNWHVHWLIEFITRIIEICCECKCMEE